MWEKRAQSQGFGKFGPGRSGGGIPCGGVGELRTGITYVCV